MLFALFAADFTDYQLGHFYDTWEVTEQALRPVADAVVRFASGTGVLVGPDLLATNHHVREAVGTHTVVVHGAEVRRVELMASDPTHDVALYRVHGEALPHVTLREAPVVVGEAVAVVGYPATPEVKTSFGAVLADALVINGVDSIEYSAQTWWGSSGSAVVDTEGRLVALHWGWDADGESNGRLLGVPTQHIASLIQTTQAP